MSVRRLYLYYYILRGSFIEQSLCKLCGLVPHSYRTASSEAASRELYGHK